MITVDEQGANAINWIEMLCDNDIKQARGMMRKGNSMCCLGVGRYLTRSGPEDGEEMPGEGELDGYWGTLGLSCMAVLKTLPDNNDGFDYLGIKAHTHPEIGLYCAMFPKEIFIPEVAAIVRDHFGWEAEA